MFCEKHSNPLRKRSFLSNQCGFSNVVSNFTTFDGVQRDDGLVEGDYFDGDLRNTNQMLNDDQAAEQAFCDVINQENPPPSFASRVIDSIHGTPRTQSSDTLKDLEASHVMNSHSNNLPDSFTGFRFNYEPPLLVSNQSSHHGSASYVEKGPFDVGLMNNAYASNLQKSSSNLDFMNRYGGPMMSSSNDHEPTDPVLKYINQALFEDNTTEERSSVLYDHPTLQAAEKPFYDAIGKKYPSSPFNHQMYVDVNAEISNGSTEENRSRNFKNKVPVGRSYPSNGAVQLAVASSKALINSRSSSSNDRSMQNDSFQTSNMISSIFSDSDTVLLFQKGMEEAMKFLPTNNQLMTNSYKFTLPTKADMVPQSVGADLEQGGQDQLPISNRARKHLYSRDGLQEEPRSRKLPVVYEKEEELPELFDKVLLYDVIEGSAATRGHGRSSIDARLRLKTRSKKRGAKNDDVDLRALLTSCVRAIASNDRMTAYKKLEQIKKHASPTGDVCQRMANAFGIGIEARLVGNGPEIYAALASRKLSSFEKLKAHEAQCAGCPFRTLGIFFANETILQVAAKAPTLHIVDFGISYGFQWPKLIQELSTREGGPPKLRITGIELPEAGFRPTALVEQTGQRLAKYCERFNVPFEYQVIATKNWETISIEDLKLARNEVLAVTCMFRFRYLLDETVAPDSPRDRVLRLIRKMKPDIFVHSIINGAHHVPLFVNRFREAFFFYSALYDTIDANMTKDHPLRLYFEEDVYGSELVNVISCEGAERVERPETYKSWQTRHMRAGLKIVPLNPELVNKIKDKTADGYHKDYEFHEDGNWILQGWKGRILYGTSCWVVK